jgi:hypothetical protein
MGDWRQEILDMYETNATINSTPALTALYHQSRGYGKSQMQELMVAQYLKKLSESKHAKRLLDEGWLPVECSKFFHNTWSQSHAQLAEMFGKENYTWTGSTFWFKTTEEIFLFKLTFGT